MASQFVLRCDGSGIETVARQFALISWRADGGISRTRRKGEHRTANAERRTATAGRQESFTQIRFSVVWTHRQLYMSNRAFLISNNTPEPSGRNSEGDLNYDFGRDVIAEGGSMLLPIFWLSLFDQSHLQFHQLDEYRIPSLVCQRAAGLALLEKNKTAVLSLFTGHESDWQRWEELVRSSQGSYFKFDGTELWDLGSDEFEPGLSGAVRWFSSRSPDDLVTLLGQSAMYRDPVSGRFKIGSKDVTGEHLYGYVSKK